MICVVDEPALCFALGVNVCRHSVLGGRGVTFSCVGCPVLIALSHCESMRAIEIGGNQVVCRPATWDEIIDLRHAVLRQGLAREEAIFKGDDAPTSRHCGAFCDGVAVG